MLSGLKVAGMIVVLNGFPDVSKTKPFVVCDSDGNAGSPFSAHYSIDFSRKCPEIHEKTGGLPC
jgi:hypothetical protein